MFNFRKSPVSSVLTAARYVWSSSQLFEVYPCTRYFSFQTKFLLSLFPPFFPQVKYSIPEWMQLRQISYIYLLDLPPTEASHDYPRKLNQSNLNLT